jgi:hypothetical protein
MLKSSLLIYPLHCRDSIQAASFGYTWYKWSAFAKLPFAAKPLLQDQSHSNPRAVLERLGKSSVLEKGRVVGVTGA